MDQTQSNIDSNNGHAVNKFATTGARTISQSYALRPPCVIYTTVVNTMIKG